MRATLLPTADGDTAPSASEKLRVSATSTNTLMPLRLSIAPLLACRDGAADFRITDFNVLNIRNTSLFSLTASPYSCRDRGARRALLLASRNMTTDRTPFLDFRRWLQLLSACLTALLIPLCFTGPAVCVHQPGPGRHAVELNWVLNGYILAYGSVIMVAGSLVDLIGPRRVWLLGLALFCAATFLPLAPSVFWMDVLRLVQGTGGAAAFAAAMSSLAPLFHGGARRAFSLLGTTFGIGLSFGPRLRLAGGSSGMALVFRPPAWSACWARPGGGSARAAACAPARLARRAVLHRRAGPVHLRMLLAPETGWRSPGVLGSLLASAVLAVAFVRVERRIASPLLELGLFRNARLSACGAGPSPAFLFIALIAMLPGRLIGMDGCALAAGQLMIGLAAPLLVVPFLAALLTRWFSHGLLSAAGLLTRAAACSCWKTPSRKAAACSCPWA